MTYGFQPVRIHETTYRKLQIIKGALEIRTRRTHSISETIDTMCAMVALDLNPPSLILLMARDIHGKEKEEELSKIRQEG